MSPSLLLFRQATKALLTGSFTEAGDKHEKDPQAFKDSLIREQETIALVSALFLSFSFPMIPEMDPFSNTAISTELWTHAPDFAYIFTMLLFCRRCCCLQ